MPKGRKLYDEDEDDEEEERVSGPCKDCQFFDVDREEDDVSDETIAHCIHPDLEEYELSVSGDSGCNLFEQFNEDEDDEDEEEEEEEEEEPEF
ncbi:MAG: hypothetical protein K1X53_16100 [Candidatus Sumerlaeaceae bacterium]|nr:hypothetical protein [Candidatus Sumerlaeaceae bacterium]